MRQVLVCVTFREFDGSTNAKIQEKFLEGLQEQRYKHFRLIVTNYREKNVRKELDKKGLPYEFHQSEKDCLCSWTEVIQNSFQYLERGQHIILWTNADNVFQPNLFSEIIKNFESGSGGTSYPHIPYANLEDFERNRPTDVWKNKPLKSFWQLDPNYWVPDTIYVDGDLLLDPDNRRLFLEYEFLGHWPGMAQTLVLAFFANKLKNLFFRSKIAMISNVRTEPKEQRGHDTLTKFCEAKGIDKKFMCHPLMKLNQHREYEVVGRVDQKLLFAAYFGYWTLYHYWTRYRSIRPFVRMLYHSIRSFAANRFQRRQDAR